MRSNGAVDIHDRVSFWKEKGWTEYDPRAPHFSSDEIVRERTDWRQRSGTATASPTDQTTVRVIDGEDAARRQAA
jgi:hypothetical protein